MSEDKLKATKHLVVEAENVLNFYDIQMKAPDPGGKAMFQAAMEDLRKAVKQCRGKS